MDSILFALWFFLPAGLANGAPVIANQMPVLKNYKQPLDFGKKYRGQRIFGNNKTFRGLLTGIVVAIVTVFLQQLAYENIAFVRDFSLIDYSMQSAIILGGLLGAGALIGDALESFIKRQLHIASGESWFPFDQLDYVFGGLLFASFVISLAFKYYVLILLIWFSMHIIFAYLFYLLGYKDKPI
jgi:CDP-2,3-bis-(O-geranylgeranyl)-sn-glycerol synthase